MIKKTKRKVNKIVFAGFRTVVWLIFQDDDTSNFAGGLPDVCLGNRGKTNALVCSVCLCWDHVSVMQTYAYVHFLQTQSITSVLTGHIAMFLYRCV